ncbi:hypothetical protein ACLOJK_002565 [Asimina triloba]
MGLTAGDPWLPLEKEVWLDLPLIDGGRSTPLALLAVAWKWTVEMGFGSCSPNFPWRCCDCSFATRDEGEGAHRHCHAVRSPPKTREKGANAAVAVGGDRRRCLSPCLTAAAREDNQTTDGCCP